MEVKMEKSKYNCLVCRNFSPSKFFQKQKPCEFLPEDKFLFAEIIKGFECPNYEAVFIKIYTRKM